MEKYQAITARSRERHRDKYIQLTHNREHDMKVEVLTYYGNNRCACTRCGFDDVCALSIDHINGDGAEMKKQGKHKGGKSFYRFLRQTGYPTGYQTLCMNCQFIKRHENREYKPKQRTLTTKLG